MRIKFFQSSTKTSLDDSSFTSTATSASYHTTTSNRAATEPHRGISPYVHNIAEQHNRPKTLSNVMQLFEENQPTRRNLHTITQADPYRVKANGAVVMNRSNIDCDDLLGTPTILGSHISATSSLEATSSTATTNASMSQPIANLDYSDAEQLSASSGLGGLGTHVKPESRSKIRMESNSSRSTFPLHDSTRFSIGSDSLCSMESWSSSVAMEQPEELLYCDQEHHVTALSPPPRNTGKKWYRDRIPSCDEEDACEALTTLDPKSSHRDYPESQTREQYNYQHDPLKNWRSMFELANQENIRLRQQLQARQSEFVDQMNHKTEALTTACRENKYLRSALSRIEMLSSANLQKEKRRRQSTGEISFVFRENEEPSMTLPNCGLHGSSSVALSYERKIKILLDEIDAMQTDEEIMSIKRSRLASKNAMLEQQLQARDESIRQLEHDLRIMQLHGKREY
ncbi:hypothetical protein BJV82DRAFT_623102 [Fennellomyces sp. T-0311]|nr:hypothetical protein BJV82DRAFT_623102 [Fennellomyces sp. T-0311]